MHALEPKIIWENNGVLVINKPAGLSVHAATHSTTPVAPTLVDWLVRHYPTITNVGEPITGKDSIASPRPGLVHRLDKDTSGVMIVAKTQPAFLYLKRKFQAHDLIKHYHALVYGKVKNDNSTINYPIGRSRHDARLRVAGRDAMGQLREASTAYQVLKYFKGYTYLEAAPLTGRTHQLRAHFQAVGHPLVNDQLYAPGRAHLPSLDRQALHAYSLQLILPGALEVQEFQAPLPADFQAALDYLEAKC